MPETTRLLARTSLALFLWFTFIRNSFCLPEVDTHTTITADVVNYLPFSVGREVAPRNIAKRLKTMSNDSFVPIFAALLLLNVFDLLILWSKENFKSFFRLKYALSLNKYRNSKASWSWWFRFGIIFFHFYKLNLNQISLWFMCQFFKNNLLGFSQNISN